MCLTTPGQIVQIDQSNPEVRIASVDFGVAVRTVNLLLTPDAKLGDYVIVHAGFATRLLAEEEAREAIAYARELSSSIASSEATSGTGGPS